MADRRRWFATVRTRTSLFAGLVVAVALVVAGTVLLALLRNRLVAAELSAASLRSRGIAALIEDGRVPEDLSSVGDEDGFSEVVAADGTILAATENVADEPPLTHLRPPAGSATESIVTDLPFDEEDRFAISARSVSSPKGPVSVLVGSSLSAADETWTTVFRFLLIGAPVLVGLVVVVTRQVVGRALAPVERIRQTVAQISVYDLHERVPEPGTGDEIDRLATSMNSMLIRLEDSSERQRRFVADASHELRSPLASARAALEVSLAHPDSRQSLLDSINDALVDQGRLESLLDDLLTLARLDDPSASLATAPVDLRELIPDIVERRRQPEIRAQIGPDPVIVAGNMIQIGRVLTNVLDNASAACRSRVEIELRLDGEDALITVDDDGPGIAAEDRDRVFERFVRLDTARTAERGTGLGLAIVSETIRAHHGTVGITDSPLGGLRVSIRLPVARTASAPRP